MKHDGFANHLVHRFFERYGKLINQRDIDEMNVVVLSCPHLKYTTIRYFNYKNMLVYCYIKSNRIVTFLTEKQAKYTQYLNTPKQTEIKAEKVFSIGITLDTLNTKV
jgi:hypothetical protein